jgi:hypothetical protein
LRSGLVALIACLSLQLGRAEAPASPVEADHKTGLSLSSTTLFAGRTTVKTGGVDRGGVSTDEAALSVSQVVAPGLTVGLGVQTTSLDLPSANTTVALPKELRAVAANLNYTHEFNTSWSGMVFANPGWYTASGGRTFGGSAFGVTTGFMARYRHSDTLSTAYGLAFDSLARSSLRVLPLFGVEWKPAEDWTVAVGFPQTAVTYSLTKDLKLSLLGEGSGGSYFVERDPLPGLAGKASLSRSRLEYYEIRTGLNLAWTINQRTSLGVTAGLVVDRSFDYHSAHYKLTSRGNAGYVSASANIAF